MDGIAKEGQSNKLKTRLTRLTPSGLLTLRGEWDEIAKKSRSRKAQSALIQLLEYTNGAIIQYGRVLDARERGPMSKDRIAEYLMRVGKLAVQPEKLEEYFAKTLTPNVVNAMSQFFLDLHFFFICVNKVSKLVKYITDADGDATLKDFWKEVKPKFELSNEVRNYYEHIDARIRMQPKEFGLSTLCGDDFGFIDRKGQVSHIRVDDSVLALVTDTFCGLVEAYKNRPDRNQDWKA